MRNLTYNFKAWIPKDRHFIKNESKTNIIQNIKIFKNNPNLVKIFFKYQRVSKIVILVIPKSFKSLRLILFELQLKSKIDLVENHCSLNFPVFS